MGKVRWIVACMICLLGATPVRSHAQTKQQAQDFVQDVIKEFFGPNWNVGPHAGASMGSRFLLQTTTGGQRSLRSGSGFNFGLDAGVDVLLNLGFRIGYTYTSSDLEFRTDNGDGSTNLDVDELGTLKSSVVSFEAMRYMLPARAVITPFAGIGLAASWWSLDEESAQVDSNDSQFRFGARASFGLQGRITDHLTVRAEGSLTNVRNPFTGNESFRVTTGTTIDEPSRVGRNDFQFTLLYYFQRPPELP